MRRLYADPARLTDAELDLAIAAKRREGAIEALAKIASSRYAGTPSGRQLRDVAGSVPTLVIWGADDAVVPPPSAGEFAREGVSVHVVPCAGHLVQVEAADEFNRLVGDFLRHVG
jgi:pyruvate dehydrogenase E2 component (dihydrolipoamide acetyltransferase)